MEAKTLDFADLKKQMQSKPVVHVKHIPFSFEFKNFLLET